MSTMIYDKVSNEDRAEEIAEIDVAVLYSKYEIKRETDASEASRDLRAPIEGTSADVLKDAAEAELVDDILEVAVEATIEVEPDAETIEILEQEIWSRLQGGRVDDELEYDGRVMRSMSTGDVVVLDGSTYVAAAIGFTEADVEIDVDEIPAYSEGRGS